MEHPLPVVASSTSSTETSQPENSQTVSKYEPGHHRTQSPIIAEPEY